LPVFFSKPLVKEIIIVFLLIIFLRLAATSGTAHEGTQMNKKSAAGAVFANGF